MPPSYEDRERAIPRHHPHKAILRVGDLSEPKCVVMNVRVGNEGPIPQTGLRFAPNITPGRGSSTLARMSPPDDTGAERIPGHVRGGRRGMGVTSCGITTIA